MILEFSTPKRALNKAFLKQRPLRSQIDMFKHNLTKLLGKIDEIEREENQKNHVRDFLRDTYYRDVHEINTKDNKDLVIHLGKSNKDHVGVIIEAKRPGNKTEMLSAERPNTKALHELVLYYLDERTARGNTELKNLIATNIFEWYIIDANVFDKLVYRNTRISRLYDTYIADHKDTRFFYEELAKILDAVDWEIPCTYFNLRNFEKDLNSHGDDRNLIALFKILSPYHLLKVPFSDDSNQLNEGFYRELLHIVGLEEVKDSGKVVIRRKSEKRNPGSIIENAINILDTDDVLHKVHDLQSYGNDKTDQLFNVALELSITWMNRILFLKLLESQLLQYHNGDKSYHFLNIGFISNYDDLYKLFHQVLARTLDSRTEAIRAKFAHIPYLNSSLFEIGDLEDQTIKINSLDNSMKLELMAGTVLKDGGKRPKALPTLEYLFKFLDAFDFAGEGSEDVQDENKSLINASVLGKVFEKINGYKDGSVFTPGFITMYMCRETIRLALTQKFSERYGWKLDDFDDIKNYVADKKSAVDILDFNRTVNELHVCDPAVGSGHFLVSSLNELIAIKYELGILADGAGKRVTDLELAIENDELVISDLHGDIFEYRMGNGKPMGAAVQRLQKTLFHEKQTLIENCLFGVDVNPKSVLICRLRLWIELLKNAYYKEETGFRELETLPNIDINIKTGNSLVSRFALGDDLGKALKSIKYNIESYRGFVADYKNEKNKDQKRGLQKIIDSIKGDFRTHIGLRDPKKVKLNALSGQLFNLLSQGHLFGADTKQVKATQKKLEAEIVKLEAELDDIKNNALYRNAFEWRFEFPEVLNNNGTFEGFDVIIGNPPYIQLQKLNETSKAALELQQYQTFGKTGDIYQLFYERGLALLKPKGHLAFITSNKWMRTDYGGPTRNLLATGCRTLFVVDFGMAQLFESATTYTNILVASNAEATGTITMCRIKNDYHIKTPLEQYVAANAVTMATPTKTECWIPYDKTEFDIISKITSKGTQLREWAININRGVLTGFNEAFIIDTDTRDRLVAEDPNCASIIRPILRGEDVKAYVPHFNGIYLINSHNGIKKTDLPSVDVEGDYPSVFAWLSKFKEKLVKRYDQGDHWTNLRNCAYLEEFSKPKIIYPNMTKFLPFAYDESEGYVCNDKAFIITGEHLKYLTGILNSTLWKFAFKERFPELLGDTREVRKVFFDKIPIIKPYGDFEEKIAGKVVEIVAAKKNGKSTAKLEREMDKLVFRLYALDYDEVKIIEPEFALTRWEYEK